jgi:pyruvate kinase
MLAGRRVKIVATIGPSSSGREELKSLINAGMNVSRLNFSHGTHEDHSAVLRNVRELSQEMDSPVAILQDLQGPKIRVGKFKDDSIELVEGQKVTITTRDVLGEGDLIPTDFETLPQDCKPGTRILLDDGLLELAVAKVEGTEVYCKVIYGGTLKNRKGMNIPGANLSVECLTPKDIKDLKFGLENKVDYVALSFVRSHKDILELRELVQKKNPSTKIVAKIEMLEALDDLEKIVKYSDAIMVARGDLAIEIGQTRLASVQKQIIRECNRQLKPVITATQMLDSMVNNPRPTRAEITDVANAILDGTDALMLSAETASGKFPSKCISTMHEIAMEVERESTRYYLLKEHTSFESVPEAIAASSCLSSEILEASVIVCLTTTGRTATYISSFRPKAHVIAVTHLQGTLNRLELVWGIQTIKIDAYDNTDEAMEQVEKVLLDYGLVGAGDRVVLTMGMPVNERAKTNALRVYTVESSGKRAIDEENLPLRFRPA